GGHAAGRLWNGQRAGVAAEAQKVEPGIRPFGVDVRVEILRGGEGVADVGLRAAGVGDGADLRAGVVLVVEPLVGFGVEIDGAGAGGAGRDGLIREIQRAARQVADHRGVAVYSQIAGEVEREGGDVSRGRKIVERWRGGITREDDVGNLLGGDARAADFNFILARRGVEEV